MTLPNILVKYLECCVGKIVRILVLWECWLGQCAVSAARQGRLMGVCEELVSVLRSSLVTLLMEIVPLLSFQELSQERAWELLLCCQRDSSEAKCAAFTA